MLKKITRVEVTNYQSHKHTVLDMDSPVVVLSGESDNGKTVIIRALQWLATNRPMGDGFVSHWQMHQTKSGKVALNSDTVCSVSVTAVDDHGTEHLIERVKTPSENYYKVDGTKLSAIGTAVPQEVTSLLCLNDENIQDQDEKYYLLTLTGSQVSSKLNELVNLDSIDDAYAIIKRQKLDEGARNKEYEAQYYEHKVAVDNLKHIPGLIDDCEEAKLLAGRMQEVSDDVDNINDLICRMKGIESKLEDLQMLSSLERAIERIGRLITDYEKDQNAVEDMEDTAFRINNTTRKLHRLPDVDAKLIEKLDKSVATYEKVNAEYLKVSTHLKEWKGINNMVHDLPEEAVAELERLNARYAELKGEAHTIGDACRKATDLFDRIEMNAARIEEYRTELPDICPLCGRPMEGHEHV